MPGFTDGRPIGALMAPFVEQMPSITPLDSMVNSRLVAAAALGRGTGLRLAAVGQALPGGPSARAGELYAAWVTDIDWNEGIYTNYDPVSDQVGVRGNVVRYDEQGEFRITLPRKPGEQQGERFWIPFGIDDAYMGVMRALKQKATS